MHWSSQYLNRPWVGGTAGPHAFDCWGLCVWVQRQHYQRECPIYDLVNPRDKPLVAVTMERALASHKWTQLQTPADGCIVALGQARDIHHVGIYIAADGGLVLHTQENSGVRAQPLRLLKTFGWNRIEFYLHRSWAP